MTKKEDTEEDEKVNSTNQADQASDRELVHMLSRINEASEDLSEFFSLLDLQILSQTMIELYESFIENIDTVQRSLENMLGGPDAARRKLNEYDED